MTYHSLSATSCLLHIASQLLKKYLNSSLIRFFSLLFLTLLPLQCNTPPLTASSAVTALDHLYYLILCCFVFAMHISPDLICTKLFQMLHYVKLVHHKVYIRKYILCPLYPGSTVCVNRYLAVICVIFFS